MDDFNFCDCSIIRKAVYTTIKMKLRLLLLSPLLGYAVAQGAQKTRAEMTAEERAVYDMQTGMMGLKEAGKLRFLIRCCRDFLILTIRICNCTMCFAHHIQNFVSSSFLLVLNCPLLDLKHQTLLCWHR